MTTVDKVAPEVEIELGGKKRKLIFDFWSFCLLEKATGRNSLSGEMFTKPSATEIVTLVWAALQSTEKLSIEEVGKMLSFKNMPMVTEAIQKAFDMSSIPVEALKKSQPEGVESSEAQSGQQ